AQYHVDGDDVRLGEQLFLAGVADTSLLAPLGRQVRTPGDHVHAERFRYARHLAAELAESDDAERATLDLDPRKGLPGLAGMHARILAPDAAGQFKDQAHGERGGGIAGILRAADGYVARLRGLHVDRRIAHAGRQQQLQLRQRLEQTLWECGAFAHGAD